MNIGSHIKVYSFNSKPFVWWQQEQAHFAALSAEVFQFDWEDIHALAALADRTMDCSITITDNSAYVTCDKGDIEVNWACLKP